MLPAAQAYRLANRNGVLPAPTTTIGTVTRSPCPLAGSSLHSQVAEDRQDCNEWDCELLFEQGVDEEGNPVYVNLCEFFVPNEMHSGDYMFPDEYQGLDALKELDKKLCAAAYHSGFTIARSRKRKFRTLTSKTPRRITIYYACIKGFLYKPKTKDLRMTRTKRVLELDQRCPFRFIVYMLHEDVLLTGNRWFLSRKQKKEWPHCCRHTGHPYIDNKDQKAPYKMMGFSDMVLAKQCDDLALNAPITNALVNTRNEEYVKFGPEQMRYFIRQLKIAGTDGNSNDSVATRLIKSFKKDSDVNYTIVTYSPELGVRMERRNNINERLLVTSPEDDEQLNNMYLDAKLDSKNKQKLLLIVAFVSDSDLRLASMHPELVCCDTTFGTQNTKNELLTVAMKDGCNTAFNGAFAYIPNSQAWSFKTFFKTCLPSLWGAEICENVRLFITDGCPQEYNAIIDNIGMNCVYPNAVHSLCYFHLGILNFNDQVRLPRSNSELYDKCEPLLYPHQKLD